MSNILNYRLHPYSEAAKISVIYGLAGLIWILFSDELLSRIVNNIDMYKKIATYKGWTFVAVTVILIYSLILNRLLLLDKALNEIDNKFEELSSANEELIALEEELRQQYEESEKHRNALDVSKQRYELAVEGADCGIWDWDVENDIYYFSQKWKDYLSFENNEVGNTFEAWTNLLHPDEKNDVISKIRRYILSKSGAYENIYRMRCKNGQYFWILSKAKAIRNAEGRVVRVAGSHTDITEQKLIEKRLNLLAYYDVLTELPNRISFEADVTRLINDENINNKNFALIYMDIDNFKHINDTIGHTSGDVLLKNISNTLKCHVKASDLVARLSGDEFAIIFNDIKSKEDITDKLQILLNNLRKPWLLEKQEFFISFSIGIAVYPEDGIDLNTLLKNADIAMYQVKKKMKDNFSFYSLAMHENSVKYIRMVNELRRAIDKEEFKLYFQPIINLTNFKLEAVEALIRWMHPENGIVSPAEFIPLAEETGLIIDIGKWALRTSLAQKKNWEEKGFPHIKMSVNVSGKSITDNEFIDDIKELILKTELNCEEIQIEVTETAIMANINTSTKILNEIKDMGMKIALDDFGTGYSSLTYLKKLPIDTVKLDRDFIKNISDSGKDNVIVESVIKLTHDLNLDIIAEGIETEEQLSFLKLNKCDYGQGYFFSKPITKEEIEKLFL